ncbi:RNA polymerase sigma factor [Pedobacter sp. MC2016-24]|uniref:RNA polymerase sigma factor n=1 Tax=Pedobacter sp. MC2016-24 TaxID=2780090 RepID=UPI001882826D|nr:sigma-70 family RNA polymerase sigma factor [Pedobacter sp. MC2016-24]MBE9598477.1 sigma-70 family RNA polymerase sigma factor [Pedobacter sp. MC2016-24]
MQENNEQAFSCLMNRYHHVLFRHISRRIQSADDAAEILQDIFISLWNKRFSVYAEESIYPYLFRAAKYETIDWIVKRQKQIARESVLLAQEEQYDFPAEDVLIARELNDLLTAEVNRMPPTMRAVFQLSREQSLSVSDIAKSLSLSEQTVKNNISFALKRLRVTLKQEHYLTVAAAILSALR